MIKTQSPRTPGIMSMKAEAIEAEYKAELAKLNAAFSVSFNLDRSGTQILEAPREDSATGHFQKRAAEDSFFGDTLHMNVRHMSSFIASTGFTPVKSPLPRIVLPGGGGSPHIALADRDVEETMAFHAARPGSKSASVWFADGKTDEPFTEQAAGIARYRKMQEVTGTHVFVVALTKDINEDFLSQLSVGHDIVRCLDNDYDAICDMVFDVLRLLQVNPKAVDRIPSLTAAAIAEQMAKLAAEAN